MPRISRRKMLWAALLAPFVLAAVALGFAEPAVSQAINGVLVPGFRIGITTANPKGCIPSSAINCTIAYIPPTGTYSKTAALTGFSYIFGNSQTAMLFEPAGTLAAGYIMFAPTPGDGAEECVFSTAAITLLYLSPSAGQTLNNAITTLAANARVCYLYSLANTSWDRSN